MSQVTVVTLQKAKEKKDKITCLTSYDATSAALVDQAGVDVILVGDSLGMVIQGESSTIPVTLEEMAYHTRCVAKGVSHALVIADLPFGSYQTVTQALASSAILMKAGANMVKLEGAFVEVIEALVAQGIPVCGHLGLLPQSVNRFGGYVVQGKGEEAGLVLKQANAVVEAGAQLLVLECIPSELAGTLTAQISIPTIGIGAGVDCDGQVLVLHDMLGMTLGRKARFVKDFLAESGSIGNALAQFVSEVKNQQFPDKQHSY
ncbi:MAG: 3-methyl-2-oxobutanoate hydroxymethyltransferase [Methylococcales bacterium]|jgi:3-methyl-2-oxobutanoate hydroxymethyltransferase|nr:3-methyl-2-oxobutanoate hydroxymethyltransferase [Methylococcales bacterium]